MEERIGLAKWKWCIHCGRWFQPRACNAEKQNHCCDTDDCKRASHNESNRKHRVKKSRDADWRHANVLRSQRRRRIVRNGFDVEAVITAVDRFFENLAELLGFVSHALRLLDSLKSLLLHTPLLRKLSGSPATVAMHLDMARIRTVSTSNKAILQLKTIPSLTLRDHDLARCA